MANEDLSKLKIDRSGTVDLTNRKRQPRFMITLAVIAALILLVVAYVRSVTAIEVESATVTTAYLSQSFSELAFGLTLNFTIIMKSFAFALIMGLTGGFLPAAQAAHLSIVDSLRAA